MSPKEEATIEVIDMPLPVACYVRVSTENQLENYSIDEQVQRLRAYCLAKGWSIFNVYIDGGYSGGNTERPALKQMLKDVKTGAIGAVVVYKLDRLSRSQKDTLTLIEDEFLAHDVDFVSINENFDTSTPFGRAMIGILSVFAQLEKDQIAERFTMGRIGRGKAGYYHGGPTSPTGYDYINGDLIINEYKANQVREAFDMFLSGKSVNAIYRELHDKYGGWSSASVTYNILRNDVYVGRVKFKGASYPGKHAPIISKETYDAVQRILRSGERDASKTSAQKTPFRAGYLLSSLIVCGRCGARYCANHGYYRCYSRAKCSSKFIVDPNCKNDNWLIEELDAYVVNAIKELTSSPKTTERIASAKRNERVPAPDPARVKSQIGDLSKQKVRLVELYQVGGVPIDELSARIRKIDREKSALEKLLNKAQSPETDETEFFANSVTTFSLGFCASALETRRLLISSIVRRVVIDKNTTVIEWRV